MTHGNEQPGRSGDPSPAAELIGPAAPTREAAAIPARPAGGSGWIPAPTNLAFAFVLLGAVLCVWGYRRIMAMTRRGIVAAASDAPDPDHLRSLIDGASRELDAKAARLEALVARAEQAAERLEHALAQPAPAPAPGITPVPSPAPSHRAPAFLEARPIDEGVDPLQREIARLRDAGLAPVQIAQKLQQPVGQVELVLALQGRR